MTACIHAVQTHLRVFYTCVHTHTHTHINARYTLTSMCGCRFQTPQDRDPPCVCLAQPANTPTRQDVPTVPQVSFTYLSNDLLLLE
jgi:hypothetical protein